MAFACREYENLSRDMTGRLLLDSCVKWTDSFSECGSGATCTCHWDWTEGTGTFAGGAVPGDSRCVGRHQYLRPGVDSCCRVLQTLSVIAGVSAGEQMHWN